MARSKYHLTYNLIEGTEEYAKEFCERINANLKPYPRRRYPAHYTPYQIKDNYGPGKDWNGWICWYYYSNC